jgi:hypothetical protein
MIMEEYRDGTQYVKEDILHHSSASGLSVLA